MKRVISLVLVFVLAVGVFSFATFADDPEQAEPGYYLVGTMTGWKIDPKYKMERVEGDKNEYSITTYIPEGEEFKAVYSDDGVGVTTWYPDGSGNNIKYSKCYYDGPFIVRLRPDGDGESYWLSMGSDPSKYVILIRRVPAKNIVYKRFVEYFDLYSVGEFMYREEACRYTDPEDESTLEWVLLQACPGIGYATEYKEEIAGRTIWLGNYSYPFTNSYGIYDAKQDKFINLSSETVDKYEGLREAFLSIELQDPAYDYEYVGYLYKKAFRDKYPNCDIISYNEPYCHRYNTGERDWVLINAFTNMEAPMPYCRVIGNRVISGFSQNVPFTFGVGIYDVKQEKFLDISDIELSEYADLEDVFNSSKIGRLIGDIDKDNKITILDATMIQRCLASLIEFPADDEINVSLELSTIDLKYCSDFNRDGSRSVLDATAIQKHLASLT